MTNKKVKILLVISILAISSLSCEVWESVFAVVADTMAVVDSMAGDDITNFEKSEQVEPESSDPSAVDGELSVESCRCPGVSVPLKEDSVRAGNNSFPSQVGDEEILILGSMSCPREEAYQSSEKSGTISINLMITRLPDSKQAQIFQTPIQNRMEKKPGYCEEDHDCTIKTQEFSPGRSFYAEEYVYRPNPDAEALPSSHFASLVKYIPRESGYYVIDLLLDHPELSPGDPWILNTASAIEICLDQVSRDW
jgi:hypothetical protein